MKSGARGQILKSDLGIGASVSKLARRAASQVESAVIMGPDHVAMVQLLNYL